MKTIENITLYKCDFCKKIYRKQHACMKHEKYCEKNPDSEDKSPCFSCKYNTYKEVGWNYEMCGYVENRTVFVHYCNKLDIHLIPPKRQRLKRYYEVVYDIETHGNEIISEFMPKECDSYKHLTEIIS